VAAVFFGQSVLNRLFVIARSESDEAIHLVLLLSGLLRFARNDDCDNKTAGFAGESLF
jgi:hypothetical protein